MLFYYTFLKVKVLRFEIELKPLQLTKKRISVKVHKGRRQVGEFA